MTVFKNNVNKIHNNCHNSQLKRKNSLYPLLKYDERVIRNISDSLNFFSMLTPRIILSNTIFCGGGNVFCKQ